MKKRISLILLALMMLASACLVSSCGLKRPPEEPKVETVYIVKDGKTDYSMVFSSQGVNHVAAASKLYAEILVEIGADMDRIDYPGSKESTEKEILIGATDRQLSIDLKAAVDKKAGDDGLAWGYAYRDGKLAYYANCPEAIEMSWDTFFSLIVKKNTVQVQSDLWVVDGMTAAEYEQYLIDEADRIQAEKEAERREKIAVIRERIASVNTTFASIPDFTPIYGTPSMEIKYSHPRVWVNEETVAIVRDNLSSTESKVSYNKILEMADLNYTGRLARVQEGFDHNFTVEGDLATIESLAMVYLVTGDELYGYSAIRAAKNFLDTAYIRPRSEWESDGTRLYTVSNACSTAMGIIAEVYDWCYDLLLDNDKTFLVEATLNKLTGNLEVANPPENGGCVTGHSTSALTLRDWPSFAIAVADEYPEIYTYIIGLAENYYAPPANWYYPAGANFQGTSYGINKTSLHLQSDLLVKTATGENLYDVSFEPTMLAFIYGIRPDDEQIRLGDNYSYGASWGYNTDWRPAFYGAFYYKNPVLKAWLMHQTENLTELTFKSGTLNKMLETSPTKALLLNDPTVKWTADTKYELSLVHYTESPLSSLFARSAWGDPDAWFTYTNMAEAYGANHDHLDAGTFQIYYKGVLAPETGIYREYGTLFDYSWTKQTIANNGLLIYNPEYEKTNSLARTYTGGQSTVNMAENPTIDHWLSSPTSKQSVVLGRSHAYTDAGELVYAYMSGDITNAYDQDTVDLVMRSTISIATGDETQPLLFIVYDRITSDDADFKKTFLLHTMDDPTFGSGALVTPDAEESGVRTVSGSNVFYYTNQKGSSGVYAKDDPNDKYNGKLTNTTLLPENPTYRVIGGDGYRFWVNSERGDVFIKTYGEESLNEYLHNLPSAETGWGRVEISPSQSNLTDSFLNVMFIGDADGNDAYVAPVLVKADTHEGAVTLGNCVMFSKSNKAVSDELSFTASGDGVLNYYVTGLSEGLWEISLDGEVVDEVTVDAESGLAEFKAGAGEITMTPKFRTIKYELGAGAFAENVKAPSIYLFGEELVLPDNLILDYFEFDGWYDNPDFNGRAITALNGDDIGNITLYAKWRQVQAKLTLELNRGTYDGELPTRYNYYEALALPEVLTKYGSTFDGWYFDADFSGERITEISENQKGDITLYAKWIKEFDVLAFELNGGEMDGDTRIKLPTEKYTLPTDITKANCTFAGWYLDEECTERVSVITPDMGDTTVYAYWISQIEDFTGDDKAVITMGARNVQYGDYLVDNGAVLTLVFTPDPNGASEDRNAAIRIRNKYMKNNVVPLGFKGDVITNSSGAILASYSSGATIEVVMDFIEFELRYYVDGVFAGRCEAAFNEDLSTYNFENNNGQTEINYFWQYYGDAPANSLFNIKTFAGDAHKGDDEFASVEYELDGGEFRVLAPNEYIVGTGATLPTPTKVSYDFLGWYDNSDFDGEKITEIPADATDSYKFYAKWEKIGEVLSFELSGGTANEEIPAFYRYGEKLVLPTGVSKHGFEFDGWYASPIFDGEKITEIPADATEPYELYAKWNKVMGFLSFNLNDGTADGVLPEEYKYGEKLVLPSKLTKYGSVFAGWYLDSAMTQGPLTELSAQQTGDLTLYAKWDKAFGVLYIDADGGTYSDNLDDVITIGKTIVLPKNITRKNAEFCGWYLDKAFTQRVETITPETNDDIYVYAKWNVLAEDSPWSTFNPLNNAVMGMQNIKYGDYLAKSNGVLTFVFEANPSSAGVARNGVIRIRNRYLKSEIVVFRFDGDKISTSASEVISNIADGGRIEVVMDFVNDKLYYVVDGEYVAKTSVNFDSDLTAYNFGMSDQSVGYLWQYNAGGNYKFDVQVWSGNITSLGFLDFELDDGAISGGGPTEYWGDEVTKLPVPTKKGFEFLGWYDNPDFSGSPVTEIAKGTSGNLKFYAKWKKSYSVVELHLNGGTVIGDFDPKITVGQEIVLPTSVSGVNGIFAGWYADEELTQPITSVTPESDAENIHVYAKWLTTYWSKSAALAPYEYYYENGDIGSAMLAENVDTLTLRLDTAIEGNENWTNGGIRLRAGTGNNEAWVINFAEGYMTSLNGVKLTAMNSGDVVNVVINFTSKTVDYYVNGVLVAENEVANVNSELLYYNYRTPAGDATAVTRSNMFQLTNAGDSARIFAYDSVSIVLGELAA